MTTLAQFRGLLWIGAIVTTMAPFSLAGNWPAWRGAEGTGVTTESNLPEHWSKSENVRWRVSLPERGNSTPIIWRNRIFVTQAIEKENRRTLMCFDRADGKLLWQAGPIVSEKEPSHETNPQCSASPVSDGERVIASFGSAGLCCFNFDGKELWRRDLGKQTHIWGNASSPMLLGGLCILNFGPGERTFLVAVDKKTGETVWRNDEPGGKSGLTQPGDRADWIGSWATPIGIRSNDREQVIMCFPGRVCGMDPKTGKEFWTCAGLNPLIYTSPLYSDGIVVAMGGFNGSALAVRANGNGDVTATHRLWQIPKTKQRIGSGVISGDHIYILNDPGIAECFELKSGKLIWENRLRGAGAKNDSWASMVLAAGKLYVINQSGDTFILRASPTFELLATNSIGETTIASLAPSDGQIFIRTYDHLWCIGKTN